MAHWLLDFCLVFSLLLCSLFSLEEMNHFHIISLILPNTTVLDRKSNVEWITDHSWREIYNLVDEGHYKFRIYNSDKFSTFPKCHKLSQVCPLTFNIILSSSWKLRALFLALHSPLIVSARHCNFREIHRSQQIAMLFLSYLPSSQTFLHPLFFFSLSLMLWIHLCQGFPSPPPGLTTHENDSRNSEKICANHRMVYYSKRIPVGLSKGKSWNHVQAFRCPIPVN